jgi:hypothetical protein
MASLRARIDHIEALVHEDVGRNVGALFAHARGGLWSAATALTSLPRLKVGLISGFYIPAADPPCAETDGPLGVALLARGLAKVGVPCRLATDELCRPACAAALAGAGVEGVAIDAVAAAAPLQGLVDDWRRDMITHAVSVERCGRGADGKKRDMRGTDISPYTADLDALFIAGPWDTIAVGDGGNEIGMGSVPRPLIADNVPNGDAIACVTPANHLVAAGVSNWGAYALVAALALLREDWRDAMWESLSPTVHHAALDAMVNRGPAVDGVFLKQSMTVDSISLARHEEKLAAIRAVITRG